MFKSPTDNMLEALPIHGNTRIGLAAEGFEWICAWTAAWVEDLIRAASERKP